MKTRLITVRASLVAMALKKRWQILRISSSAPDQHDTVKKTVMEEDFWSEARESSQNYKSHL